MNCTVSETDVVHKPAQVLVTAPSASSVCSWRSEHKASIPFHMKGLYGKASALRLELSLPIRRTPPPPPRPHRRDAVPLSRRRAAARHRGNRTTTAALSLRTLDETQMLYGQSIDYQCLIPESMNHAWIINEISSGLSIAFPVFAFQGAKKNKNRTFFH